MVEAPGTDGPAGPPDSDAGFAADLAPELVPETVDAGRGERRAALRSLAALIGREVFY